MIGLVKLTGLAGTDVFINPNHISYICPDTPEILSGYLNWEESCRRSTGKGALILISGTPIQVKENPNMVINAITRLRRLFEKNALKVRKEAERSEWDTGYGDDDDSVSDD